MHHRSNTPDQFKSRAIEKADIEYNSISSSKTAAMEAPKEKHHKLPSLVTAVLIVFLIHLAIWIFIRVGLPAMTSPAIRRAIDEFLGKRQPRRYQVPNNINDFLTRKPVFVHKDTAG